jgi:hypothetical protein
MIQIAALLEPKPSRLWRLVKQAGINEVVTLLDGSEQNLGRLRRESQYVVPSKTDVRHGATGHGT